MADVVMDKEHVAAYWRKVTKGRCGRLYWQAHWTGAWRSGAVAYAPKHKLYFYSLQEIVKYVEWHGSYWSSR